MRVLVCGGRDYDDHRAVYGALDALQERHGYLTIIQGGATGADSLARAWCCQPKQRDQIVMVNVPADWKQHGRAAGPLRNARMIAVYHPDLVLAFPGGRGTADLVRKAEAAGIPVRRVPAPSLSAGESGR